MSVAKVVATITQEEWKELIRNGELFSSKLNKVATDDLISELKEHYMDFLDVTIQQPIYSLRYLFGKSINIDCDSDNIVAFLDVFEGCVVLELEVDDDYLVDFSLKDLFNQPTLTHSKTDKKEISVAFLPYIELEWVKKYWALNESWGLKIQTADKETLRKMDVNV